MVCFFLGNRDSNPNKQSQSLSCCRYTIPQYSEARVIISLPLHFVNKIFQKK